MALVRVPHLPDGPGWLYEIKFDGYRCLAVKHRGAVRLVSRSGKDLSTRFPLVAAEINSLKVSTAVLDGEIVALDAAGRPRFEFLQNPRKAAAIVFYAFDLLAFNGRDLSDNPLTTRRRMLREVLRGSSVRFSPSLSGSAKDVITAVGALGLEGVVAKRLDSPYRFGQRPGTWMKVRIGKTEDFVVGGYTPSSTGPSSLLVGYFDQGRLVFAGHVRSGITPHTRRLLQDALDNNRQSACPFEFVPVSASSWASAPTRSELSFANWVKPAFVVRVRFVEWPQNGTLRHAEYVGFRGDADPDSIARSRTARRGR